MKSFQLIYPKNLYSKNVLSGFFFTTSWSLEKSEQACPKMAWESAEKSPCYFAGDDIATRKFYLWRKCNTK